MKDGVSGSISSQGSICYGRTNSTSSLTSSPSQKGASGSSGANELAPEILQMRMKAREQNKTKDHFKY
jgi:hypothetical protein